MTVAFAKLSLLFIGGLTLGMVMPWGFSQSKSGNAPEDGRSEHIVTVRCIVQYEMAPAGPNRFGGRNLPAKDEPLLPLRAVAQPVEVRVQPNTGKAAPGSEEVIVNFYVNPCCNSAEPEKPRQERQMPDAM
jgi:hypothetical protein